MMILTGIINWFKDPKNGGIIRLIGIAIIVALFLFQCNKNQNLQSELEKEKTEAQRITNNYEAKNAPLIQQHINDSTLLAERQILKLSIDELKNDYSDLLVGFEKFKKQNPRVIEKITFNNTEKIIQVPVSVKMDSLGNGTFTFKDSVSFADGNYRKLTGTVPFINTHYKKSDSSLISNKKLDVFSRVVPGPADFLLDQGIRLKVGLFEDPKTKKVTIGVTTSYPGIKFTQLEGADIMKDETSRKATKPFRKTWGIGLSLSYGGTVTKNKVSFGPQIGVGINYTPKWLQWGK